jgi:hypothetical protein
MIQRGFQIAFAVLFAHFSLVSPHSSTSTQSSSAFFDDSFNEQQQQGGASSSASALGELSPHLFLSSKTPYYSGALGASEPVPSQCKLVHINHLGKSLFSLSRFLFFHPIL